MAMLRLGNFMGFSAVLALKYVLALGKLRVDDSRHTLSKLFGLKSRLCQLLYQLKPSRTANVNVLFHR